MPFFIAILPGCEQYKELAEGQLPQADDAIEGEEGDGGAVQEGSKAVGKAVGAVSYTHLTLPTKRIV